MRVTKEIKERIERRFDVRFERKGKFYFFYYQEECETWILDIYVDDEIDETIFLDTDQDVIEEIKDIK